MSSRLYRNDCISHRARLRMDILLLSTFVWALPGVVVQPSYAGCCKVLQQREDSNPLGWARTSLDSGTVSISVGGFVQGPADDSVIVNRMIAAIRIPWNWSDVAVTYEGQATVTLGGQVIAELDTDDVAGIEQEMVEHGIPFDPPLELPQWQEDSGVAAIAEATSPSGPGFYWVGFSSPTYDITALPESVTTARVDGEVTFSIDIAIAPEIGPVELRIFGGDDAEGLTTVSETLFSDFLSVPAFSPTSMILLLVFLVAAAVVVLRRQMVRRSMNLPTG